MLTVGIIGTGAIAEAHIRAYRDLPDEVRVVALADSDAARAERARREHGLEGVRAHGDPADLLAAGDVDLVSICTPPASHADLAIRALEAGAHVILEKPMAPSLEECDRILAAQRRSGRLLSVIAQNRFRDDLARLKAVLEDGRIGAVTHARISSAWWRGRSYYDLWWRGTWASEGGGCTLNHAIHHLDLTLWLLGRPQSVVAMMTNAAHENAEVEDLSVAILRYGRALAELTASVVDHGEEQEIVLQGERARISQPWRVVAERARPDGFPDEEGEQELVREIEEIAAGIPPLSRTGHGAQIADVVAAVRDGREPAVTGEDGRAALELVTAIYAAAIEREVVDLPIGPEHPYYRAGTLEHRAPHFFEKTASVPGQGGCAGAAPAADAPED